MTTLPAVDSQPADEAWVQLLFICSQISFFSTASRITFFSFWLAAGPRLISFRTSSAALGHPFFALSASSSSSHFWGVRHSQREKKKVNLFAALTRFLDWTLAQAWHTWTHTPFRRSLQLLISLQLNYYYHGPVTRRWDDGPNELTARVLHCFCFFFIQNNSLFFFLQKKLFFKKWMNEKVATVTENVCRFLSGQAKCKSVHQGEIKPDAQAK